MILNTDTIKIFIPSGHLHEVSTLLKTEKVWYGPFRRVFRGYNIEIKDGPMASYLQLKYGNNEGK